MALYSLADFIVDLDHQHDFLTRQCMEYRYDGTAPADFIVRVTEEELRREQSITPDIHYSEGVAAQPNAIAALSDRGIGCVACGWRKYHEAQSIHISACQGLGSRMDERSTQMP